MISAIKAKTTKKDVISTNLNHKLTDYFNIRKSDRRTKREVQEEQRRLFEFALRKGIEDGLEVDCNKGKNVLVLLLIL